MSSLKWSDDSKAVLEVKDLKTRFRTQDGVVHAVNGISFHNP